MSIQNGQCWNYRLSSVITKNRTTKSNLSEISEIRASRVSVKNTFLAKLTWLVKVSLLKYQLNSVNHDKIQNWYGYQGAYLPTDRYIHSNSNSEYNFFSTSW